MEHLEGRESVLAALAAGRRRFQIILIRHGSHAEKVRAVVELAGKRGVPVKYVERAELDAMAHGATHGGVIAICSGLRRTNEGELLEIVTQLREPALLLLLEGIDDARNLGFVLRTAEAMGVHAVLIKKHVWDFDEVEVGRPASGALERLPLVMVENLGLLKELRKRELMVVGCVPKAKRRIYDIDLAVPTVLAIGGEKRGLSGAVRGLCDFFVTIPTRGAASSLSLSHSAAIALAEAMRQRGETAPREAE